MGFLKKTRVGAIYYYHYFSRSLKKKKLRVCRACLSCVFDDDSRKVMSVPHLSEWMHVTTQHADHLLICSCQPSRRMKRRPAAPAKRGKGHKKLLLYRVVHASFLLPPTVFDAGAPRTEKKKNLILLGGQASVPVHLELNFKGRDEE